MPTSFKTFYWLLPLCLLLGFQQQKPAPDYINAQWANNKLWYDGNAEVNIYEAEMVIYGKSRKFDYVYVWVKEDFNPTLKVKTDDYSRKDLVPVMKINQFAQVPTDNYPYNFLTSVFLRFNDPSKVYKLTTSSQEWCGNTFKEFLETANGYRFVYHSYWDGQGDGEANVADAWFEDQLPGTLRALKFAEGLQFKHAVFPTQKSSKAIAPKAEEGKFSVASDGEKWRVRVNIGGKESSYWFEKVYPNKFVAQQTWYGTNLKLKKSERYPYWSYTPNSMK